MDQEEFSFHFKLNIVSELEVAQGFETALKWALDHRTHHSHLIKL